MRHAEGGGLTMDGLSRRERVRLQTAEMFKQDTDARQVASLLQVRTMWAESSHREVRYALCEDKPTLIWFANQRAVEYHVTLGTAGHLDRPSYLVLDIDPPAAGQFGRAVAAARLVREALSGAGLAGAVKTSGAKGVHIYVPVQELVSADDAAAATRALAQRAARLDPGLATTAFIKADRGGLVFIDSTRAHGATVVAAYSPRARPGVPVSFPVAWDALDEVSPGDFTVRNAARLLTGADPWAAALPLPQALPEDLIAEGHTIPVARVQAMHEGKRRARAQRDPSHAAGRRQSPAGRKPGAAGHKDRRLLALQSAAVDHSSPGASGTIIYQELGRQDVWAFWCSPPSDTQTGEFSPKPDIA